MFTEEHQETQGKGVRMNKRWTGVRFLTSIHGPDRKGGAMLKRKIEATSRPQPIGPYSQGLRAGDFIFVSGQGPFEPSSGDLCGDNIEEQTARTLGNIKAILEAGGASMADVVKVTAHLSDMSLFERYNRAYSNYFPDPKPARTTVGAQLLGNLVEIDAIAYVRPK